MRFLRQNTATRVTVGPFLDVTDAKTAELAISAAATHITLVVDDVDGSPEISVPTLVIDIAATASAGNNDLVGITNNNAGYYSLELTAAQTNYVGRAMLSLTWTSTSPLTAEYLPVFHEFTILPANVFDSFHGTDLLDVNVEKINDTELTGDGSATPWGPA